LYINAASEAAKHKKSRKRSKKAALDREAAGAPEGEEEIELNQQSGEKAGVFDTVPNETLDNMLITQEGTIQSSLAMTSEYQDNARRNAETPVQNITKFEPTASVLQQN